MSSKTHNGRTITAVQTANQNGTQRLIAWVGALLAYAPFGWWIADTYPSFAIIGGVAAVAIATAPDTLASMGIPSKWTHSVVGAVAIGGLLAAAGWWFASEITLYAGRNLVTSLAAAKYGFVVGGLSAFGHLLANGLTGTDIHPLWPVSNREGSIDLLPLVDIRNNNGFNVVGTVIVVASVSSFVTAMVLPV